MATVLDAAKALAASTGARAASTATEAMADPAVNAIMIATSSDTHVELLYEAVKTGTPVLCEKPLASSYDASREYAWLRAGPDIDRFMAAAELNVGLLLDTGPCIFGGTDPAAMAERYMGRIGHIHRKNIRRPVIEQVRAEKLSFLEDVQRGGAPCPAIPLAAWTSRRCWRSRLAGDRSRAGRPAARSVPLPGHEAMGAESQGAAGRAGPGGCLGWRRIFLGAGALPAIPAGYLCQDESPIGKGDRNESASVQTLQRPWRTASAHPRGSGLALCGFLAVAPAGSAVPAGTGV